MKSVFPDIDRSRSPLFQAFRSMGEKVPIPEEIQDKDAYGLIGSKVFGFRGGTKELIQGIEKLITNRSVRERVEIRRNTQVTGISFSAQYAQVRWKTGQDSEENVDEYDHIVSALPAQALYNIMPRSKNNIHTPFLAPMLSPMKSTSVRVTHVILDESNHSQYQNLPKGFGALQPSDAGWNADPYLLGIIFDSDLYQPSGSFRKFTVMFRDTNEDLDNRAIKLVYRLVYSNGNQYKYPKVLYVETKRLEDCIPEYGKGHERRIRSIEDEIEGKRLWVLGAWMRGVGVPSLMKRAAGLAETFPMSTASSK